MRPLASGGTPGAAGDVNALHPGPPATPGSVADHLLGQQLAAWIVERGPASMGSATLLSQVQDWLGADTALLLPLRDLLQRPAFRSLFSGEAASVQRGRRDALLADLAGTYAPAVLQRLALVIDGCLGLPAGTPGPSMPASTPGPGPATGQPSSWESPPQAHASVPAWMAQPTSYPPTQTYAPAPGQPPSHGPGGSQGYGPSQGYGVSQGYGAPPGPGPVAGPYGPSAYGPPAGYPSTPTAAIAPGNRGGGSPLTALLIVLVALLVGGVLAGLGWMLLLNRPSSSPASGASSSPPAQPQPATTSPAAPAPSPQEPPKAPATETPSGAWGSSAEYKFGRLPGGDYPNSCAFSRTDEAGQKTIDKSQVEYWACRDIGGDAERGYNVAWADGKQTTYTFRNDGSGAVVGTNGSSYPMNWRNDSHQGSNIIVINHQDGATTWIPGHVQ